jgi:hypothetical protein
MVEGQYRWQGVRQVLQGLVGRMAMAGTVPRAAQAQGLIQA